MTKRILITGSNKSQFTRKYYLGQQLKVIPSNYSLYNCLVDMGFEVEQRVVELGEDISGYDEVFVYLTNPRSLTASHFYNGLWAVSQRPNCIIAYDDWNMGTFQNILNCRDEAVMTCKFILDMNSTTVDAIKPYINELKTALNLIGEMQLRTLISAFSVDHITKNPEEYGPILMFGEAKYPLNRIFYFNPNPYHRNRKPGDYGHEGVEDPHYKPPVKQFLDWEEDEVITKERRFNCASLIHARTQKWLKTQGVTLKSLRDENVIIKGWPVDLYGSKKNNQKRVTEDEMCKIFTRDWGCLMSNYEFSGSGLWRARPLQVADVGSIIIGDKRELDVCYGQDFIYNTLNAKDLADCSDEELRNIAKAQRDALYSVHPLDKNVQQQEMIRIMGAPK